MNRGSLPGKVPEALCHPGQRRLGSPVQGALEPALAAALRHYVGDGR